MTALANGQLGQAGTGTMAPDAEPVKPVSSAAQPDPAAGADTTGDTTGLVTGVNQTGPAAGTDQAGRSLTDHARTVTATPAASAGVRVGVGPPSGAVTAPRSLGGPPTELAWHEVATEFGGRSAPAELVRASSRPPAAAGPRAHSVRAGLPGGAPEPAPGDTTPPDQRRPQPLPPEPPTAERSGTGQAHSAGVSFTLPVDGYPVRPKSVPARPAMPSAQVRGGADEPTISPD